MKPLIIANWKMNPTSLAEAKKMIVKGAVICPPFVYLGLLRGELGAQNCSSEEKGAFTGEISPLTLKDLKIKYVILGHSERRKLFSETDEMINKKVRRALASGLKVVLCVGEIDKKEVLKIQLEKGLEGVSRDEMSKVIIAYEPVWAIGTGKNCSVDETMSSIILIRQILSNLFSRAIADKIPILYGGSVNSSNSGAYIKEAGANGLLVGGASLKPDELSKIIKSSY